MTVIRDLRETMLCSTCGEIVIDFTKKYGYHLLESQDDCHEQTHDGIESLDCEGCDRDIEEEEVYFILSVDDTTLNDIADKVGENISGCSYCEGEERAYFVHAFNDDPFDPSSRMEEPEGMSVESYLFDQDVPEELHSLMTKHLECKCGRGRDGYRPDDITGGVFSPSDEIYTKNDVVDFWGYDYETFSDFSAKYGENIEVDDLINFKKYLSKYPMLALKHPTGRAIYSTLEKHYTAKEYHVLSPEIGTLYRGRTRKRDNSNVFTDKDMWSPPAGLPQHGRYNCIGVPVLYVCDNVDAVPYEIHPTHDDVIDIGEFQILEDELHLFDLGSFDPYFQGFFNEENEETKILKQAYLLPNFIGTCCSAIGYHGVKYEGVHRNRFSYTNFALFNITPGKDIKVNEVISYSPQFTITMEKIPLASSLKPLEVF
ncbi:RES domain-containing protein [Paenibacillus glucanolyticus]|jgi:hypothetical protein|uniref:Uncharacterized protein n=1 Tax=Paenibacillus glucanolyticus TaxID=59843 RepID=A0A163GMP1_9BACL|nr:RES domain-containing protein [Paenibacillus glucanolyticus]KZS45049.1 hypothetical protein AWU65_03445 [Paenibacillus glucanolyticus]OMF66713.1 hypothetical protein BK142_29270 [Paenibacillus glucanolyticus]